MEVVCSLDDLRPGAPSVATIGVFDGMHLGHQAIMRVVKKDAAARNARAVAVTFAGNPMELVDPQNSPLNICTTKQKLDLIAAQGIDLALVLPLDPAVMNLPPEQFIEDVLYGGLSAVEVVVGRGFRFGRRRAGDERMLADAGRRLGFAVTAVEPEAIDYTPISSTAIRGFIQQGDVERAGRFLGHPFVLSGVVVRGDGIGRTLGYPTANIEPAGRQIVPGNGVYAVSLRVDGKPFTGVLNAGTRPTIGAAGSVSIEVYIIGFSGNIYERQLEIAFRHRLRREMRFESVDALKREIGRDVERAVALLG